MSDSWPTEIALTTGVEAAAREMWESQRRLREDSSAIESMPPWEEASAPVKHSYRSAALPLVKASLEAIEPFISPAITDIAP